MFFWQLYIYCRKSHKNLIAGYTLKPHLSDVYEYVENHWQSENWDYLKWWLLQYYTTQFAKFVLNILNLDTFSFRNLQLRFNEIMTTQIPTFYHQKRVSDFNKHPTDGPLVRCFQVFMQIISNQIIFQR